jgi:hypothetical protein
LGQPKLGVIVDEGTQTSGGAPKQLLDSGVLAGSLAKSQQEMQKGLNQDFATLRAAL